MTSATLPGASAAAAFGGRPPAERQAYLPPLLRDPLRAVRIAAARSLADIPDGELEPAMRPLRRALLADFVAAQRAMADMPSAQFNLAALARFNVLFLGALVQVYGKFLSRTRR